MTKAIGELNVLVLLFEKFLLRQFIGDFLCYNPKKSLEMII